MRIKIVDALLDFASTEEGHQILLDLLDIDNFVRADDSDYDVVRETLQALATDASQFIK